MASTNEDASAARASPPTLPPSGKDNEQETTLTPTKTKASTDRERELKELRKSLNEKSEKEEQKLLALFSKAKSKLDDSSDDYSDQYDKLRKDHNDRMAAFRDWYDKEEEKLINSFRPDHLISKEIMNLFNSHRKKCTNTVTNKDRCILCCRMWDPDYPPERDDALWEKWDKNKGSIQDLICECQTQYEKFLPDEDNVDSVEKLKARCQPCVATFVDSLWKDISIQRDSPMRRSEVYYDYFYQNLLRQLLETIDMTTDAREILVKSEKNEDPYTTGTKRKADFVCFDKAADSTRYHLVLESALGRYGRAPSKTQSNRAKVAMDMYNEAAKFSSKPPIGILAFQANLESSNEKKTSNNDYTNKMSVLTLKRCSHTRALVLVTLASFECPMIGTNCETLFVKAVWNLLRLALFCSAMRREHGDNEEGSLEEDWQKLLTGNPGNSDGELNVGTVCDEITKSSDNVAPSTVKKTKTENDGVSASASSAADTSLDYQNCPCMLYKQVYHTFHQGNSYIIQVESTLDGKQYIKKQFHEARHYANERSALWSISKLSHGTKLFATAVHFCPLHKCVFVEELDHLPWSKLLTDDIACHKACIDLVQSVSILHNDLDIAHCDLSDTKLLMRPSQNPHSDGQLTISGFDLSMQNASYSDVHHVPEGSFGWSYQGAFGAQTCAKGNDERTVGLLLATLCTKQAYKINDPDGSMSMYYGSSIEAFAKLVDPESTSLKGLRLEICKIGYDLFTLSTSISAALKQIESLSETENSNILMQEMKNGTGNTQRWQGIFGAWEHLSRR